MNEKELAFKPLIKKISIITVVVLIIISGFFEFSDFSSNKDFLMLNQTVIRFLSGILLVIMVKHLGYGRLFQFKNIRKTLIFILPALIISINNFPIIAFFEGRAVLTDPMYRVFLFLLECISVGFFEEIIFRAILLFVLYNMLSKYKFGLYFTILISAVIFGIFHFFNLISGASFVDTLLQVGYSFLLGIMWAVVYLRTKNIWFVMVLHATYNFFGQVMFYLGEVQNRFDIYTIIITVVFSVLVSIYILSLKKDISESDFLKAK